MIKLLMMGFIHNYYVARPCSLSDRKKKKKIQQVHDLKARGNLRELHARFCITYVSVEVSETDFLHNLLNVSLEEQFRVAYYFFLVGNLFFFHFMLPLRS